MSHLIVVGGREHSRINLGLPKSLNPLEQFSQQERSDAAWNDVRNEFPSERVHQLIELLNWYGKDCSRVSQPVFASILNVPVATARSWEQGTRSPSGAALRLLELVRRCPSVIAGAVAA